MEETSQDEIIKELKRTHALYKNRIARWTFYKSCYDGVEGLVDGGYIQRHERESAENFDKRTKELYGFSYSEAIISLFNLYLFEKEIIAKVDVISDNKSWMLFQKDCDLYKSSFDQFILQQQREASIYGHMGILVDKPTVEFETKEEEIKRKIYPYVSAYAPENILDWEEDRDEYNRPFLSYLKLREDGNVYKLWYPDKWESWKIVLNEDKSEKAEMIDNGINPLREIPFVWLYNLKTSANYMGKSDISTVSYIDFSIVRNLSQGEEIIDYSAFPMMRKPKDPRGEDDDTGPTVVLEFDPQYPEAKPDWLEAKCKEPIDAVLSWIDKKVQEIYRVVNSGGIAATEVSGSAKSGVALSMEFRLLDRKLVGKGNNVANAKLEITRLWLSWENLEDKIDDISYSAPESYDVKSLAVDLTNAVMGQSLIKSETFSKETQKIMTKRMLPNVLPTVLKVIEEEIDSYKPPDFDQLETEFDE